MRYKGVIFDLDGTLLNTLLDLADSVNYALEQYGLPGHETDAYRQMIGGGFANLIDRAITASIRKMQASAAADALLAQKNAEENAAAPDGAAMNAAGSPANTASGALNASADAASGALNAQANAAVGNAAKFGAQEVKPVLTDVAGVDELPGPPDAVSMEQAFAKSTFTGTAGSGEAAGAGMTGLAAGSAEAAGAGTPGIDDDVLPSGRMTESEKAALHQGVFDAFTEEYSRRYQRSTAPYPGVQAMLSHLADAGVRIAVNSNKRDDYTKNLISRNFPDLEWTMVLGGGKDLPRKPDPAGALRIAEQMKFKPRTVKVQENAGAAGTAANPFEAEEPKKGFLAGLFSRKKEGEGEKKQLFTEMAYVGDSNVDMQTAKNAGMTAVGVSWGFRGRKELEESGADFIADDPLELEEFLLSDR